MEWMNRSPRPGQTANQPAAPAGPLSQPPATRNNDNKLDSSRMTRLMTVGLLFSVGILLVAFVAYIVFGKGTNTSAAKYVDTSKMQAVFLNGGQVYFGNITTLNDRYMRISNIYYLRVNQTVQPDGNAAANNNDISLVKLGCELHGPQDQMVVNQDQVIFWENLKDDGQVAKAVAEYKKQNPNGQQCTATQQPTSSNSGLQNTTNTTPSNTKTNNSNNSR